MDSIKPELTKYEVTFVVRKSDGRVDHKWTAVWRAVNFAHAEHFATEQLAANGDNDSVIERIELW